MGDFTVNVRQKPMDFNRWQLGLYYVKVYPLQEILAFEFGMVQSTANEWIHILSEVLQKALDHGGYVPERNPQQLATVLESEAEVTYGIDGTERPRQRPRDAEKQKNYYSGKKKPTRGIRLRRDTL
jgi:hypothetical protein